MYLHLTLPCHVTIETSQTYTTQGSKHGGKALWSSQVMTGLNVLIIKDTDVHPTVATELGTQ